jgi:error-prone DNA polymerase
VNQTHLEALAAAGALDALTPSRRAATWSAAAAAQSRSDRLPGIVTGTQAPDLPIPTAMERVSDDIWSLGLTPEATTMELLRPMMAAGGVLDARSLATSEGRVEVAGVVTHRQHPETARGAVFLNLEDETGHVNVIFSKGAWLRWRHVAERAPALVIRGMLEHGQGTTTLVAEHVRVLELATATPPSRDFR